MPDVAASAIPGVQRSGLVAYPDARGTLREIWRRSSQRLEPRQALVTSSTGGALRGMHVHLKQTDLAYVVAGRVFMALADLRTDPVTKEELWLDESETLLIPPGVAHGYTSDGGATVLYLLTEEANGSDELGFRFDDPELGIAWPVKSPTLSDRDRNAGSIRAAIAAVRGHAAISREPAR